MMNNNRYWLFLCTCLLIGLVQVTTKNGISQWKLEQAQRYAEQRFLGYIAEARRTLKRFYYLPYLVTNDETSVRFIDGEARLEKRIKKQLIQLDKAANTKGWYLLSGEGDLLVSSVERSKLSNKNASTIVSKIHQQGGAISVVTKNKGVTPDYFIAAPVYRASDVVGIVAVQIDLSLLTDQWFADGEAILFQNPRDQFFLSSDNRLSADWFNDTFNSQPSTTKRELYDQTHIRVWRLQGKDYLIQSIKLDDLNWRLTYLTPLTSLNQTTNWISWSVAVGCLFIMLLLVILYQRRQKKLSNLRIQKLIEESEKRLSGMINKTHVGLILIDKHGRIHDINLMAKNYFSLSDSMINNIKAWQLFEAGNPNSTTLQLLKNLDQHQELAEITSVETMARRSDGSYFPVLFSISAFPWHATTYYLCTVIDISKRKKAEIAVQNANKTLQLRVEERTQDLKDAQQELVESSKLAALGRMSSAITHELNQPLTGLKTLLSSNQLLMERGETKMLKANMDLVMSLIDRMANMTSQLKSFAFQRLEKPYPVSLTDALQETLRIHQTELDSVDIRVRVASNISMVMGEEARLRQVLGNLLRNAIDATKNQTPATIVISAHADQQRVIIKVQDNGCGVSEDQLETIFEPFHTNKKMGEGLGLGLAITANNVRDMQGTLIAKNNSDQGMTFTLTLKNIDSK
ncbi:sensor histidine kinase [Vibrio crassostreae]|uniref:sensor histidine kinase n=1 Tax=Vibrio crassostreae TaxID=246167 RepID=UPI000303041F|nr:ATP-binding protein [Vibrio crassostreae]OEE95447.1 PAS domain-containing sensor histidine kinase [Vibrio crassostreae 9ZC77]